MHDATKTLMGTTESSDREITNYSSDPASFPEGKAVRLASTGALSLSSGSLVGISLGASLSDTKKTAVARVGNRVPLELTDEGVYALLVVNDLTFTAKAKGVAGNSITIALTDTVSAGDEEATLVGTDIVVEIEDGVSTATQVKAALDAVPEIVALITTTISGTASDAQAAASEAPLATGADSYPYVVPGAAVRVNSTTGVAISTSGTLTGACYCDFPKTGVKMDGSTIMVGLVDMGGGL